MVKNDIETPTKLKPTKWGAIFALIVVVSIVLISVFIIISAVLDEETELKAYGILFLVFGVFNLTLWLIRKDFLSLSLILINLTMSVRYLFDYNGFFFTVTIVLLYILYFYLLYMNSKYNSHYRHLLELAAKPVNGTADGFTPRPFPVGEATFTREKLYQFAKFLKRHFLAFPYIEKDGIILALTDQSKFWFGRPNVLKDTYISFNLDGKVSVNIAQKDYQKFREEFTFDHLCSSLGNLFIEFLELYGKGDGNKIIDKVRKWNT